MRRASLPKVVLHVAVSLDGRIDRFEPDIGRFYALAGTFGEDATLIGSETIMKAPEGAQVEAVDAPTPPPRLVRDPRPWLVIADSRGRVKCWNFLLASGHWNGALALCSRSTPASHLAYLKSRRIPVIRRGKNQVDLKAALRELRRRFQVRRVRVDSGGTLNGALLSAGLVDKVSLLVHPVLVGDSSPRSFFHSREPDASRKLVSLRPQELQKLPGGLLWLRYQVGR
jgi:2,5-diamino-6-(ribosylamino)-4(3H)-pyrimidinone 5'-phosphate reductase